MFYSNWIMCEDGMVNRCKLVQGDLIRRKETPWHRVRINIGKRNVLIAELQKTIVTLMCESRLCCERICIVMT